jgi:hypothetical protein
MWARWFAALGGWLENVQQLTTTKIALFLRQSDLHQLAGQDTGHKNHTAIFETSEPFAPRNQLFNTYRMGSCHRDSVGHLSAKPRDTWCFVD